MEGPKLWYSIATFWAWHKNDDSYQIKTRIDEKFCKNRYTGKSMDSAHTLPQFRKVAYGNKVLACYK